MVITVTALQSDSIPPTIVVQAGASYQLVFDFTAVAGNATISSGTFTASNTQASLGAPSQSGITIQAQLNISASMPPGATCAVTCVAQDANGLIYSRTVILVGFDQY